MRRIAQEIRHLVGPLNPAPPVDDGHNALSSRAEHDLKMILAEDISRSVTGLQRSSWRSHRHTILMVGAAVVLVAAVTAGIAIPWQGSRGVAVAYAATPEPLRYQPEPGSAAMILRAEAERIQRQAPASTDDQTTAYQHIVLDRWSLSTRVNGTNVTSVVLPSRTELWLAPDQSAIKTTRYEQPKFDGEQQRKAWEEQGSPGSNSNEETAHYAPGTLPSSWESAGPPPTDIRKLTAWLQIGHPPQNGPVETLVAWKDLTREFVPDAKTRANLLKIVAGLPGLVYDGRTTDRAGRHGLAFSITDSSSGLQTKNTVIIDQDTGALLASEEMLTTSAGKLNVRIPAVISYDTYLTSERVRNGPTR